MTVAVNKRAVAAAFGRAAPRYDDFADLQRQSAQLLTEHCGAQGVATVLDAGCGTGAGSLDWRARGCDVTAFDLSPAMLSQARERSAAHRYVQGDIEALPFTEGSFDLVWSNLAVQWCQSLSGALEHMLRVTRPGGRVAFTTLAHGSLCELHQAWAAVDHRAHANGFSRPEDIHAAAPAARLTLRQHPVTLLFGDALSAMQSLKGIGATHLHAGRASRTLTRRELRALHDAWPRQGERFPLTYQLISGVIERD
ncbi:Biotin synthesis protein bioC [Cronobacter condimenti 1330]|uniref:Malonyl-[acyl-carrier protein] O-methyltransferase n=1 Tax=Cronobacter condimenti 1330 TaxID=1073999 RepID=K8AK24_9ENTR|nr:malonyl-ACP O-methyltransferase BioC [Cronobacter condimenti]ALB62141.1 biotin biosynthesis protein BioC [Cronobacter condimenti 1330]CCJ74602.1 Biotin synthesis protein bioC [Cronobacter condimenti 1330]